ncbi:MAG: hypothetical protein BGO67_01155 [Alphaproteobacteria bacterium 41-28]|nr:MAG: hypothetical protein BGO67_01155 [Alphaproteobacteria bacterium 41-28]
MIYFLANSTVQLIFTFVIIFFLFIILRKTLTEFSSFEALPLILPIASHKRQPFGEVATKVTVGLYVHNFPRFSVEDSFFSLDGTIWFEFNPSQISLEDLGKFEFFEGKITMRSIAQIKQIDENIFVSYNFKVTFSSLLNHEKFPFNDHRIFLILKNEFLSAREIHFFATESGFSVRAGLRPQGWKLVKTKVETGMIRAKLEQFDARKTMLVPVTVFEFDFSKPGFRYVLLTLVPGFILFYLAVYSILLEYDPQMTDPIIAISLASITGLIIQRFVIENISPISGHSTTIDYIFILFLSLCFSIFIFHLYIFEGNSIQLVNYLSFYAFQVIMLFLFWRILRLKTLETLYTKRIPLFRYPRPIFKKKDFLIHELMTLKNYQQYANNFEEFPQRDNVNPLVPDYSKYLHAMAAPIFVRYLKYYFNKMRFYVEEDTPTYLKRIMDYLLEKQNLNKSDGFSILLHRLKKGEKFYIWGDLYGSLHSLVRTLAHLEKQGVINDKLEILKPNCFLIFNGNIVGRSAYNLENLSLIVTLMLKNPQKVFFIRRSEKSRLWINFEGIRRELAILVKDAAFAENLLNQFMRFLDILPVTLYLGELDKELNTYITISPRSPILADSKLLSKAFKDMPYEEFRIITINNPIPRSSTPFIQVRLRSTLDEISYIQPRGVNLLPPEEGSTQWAIFSAPLSGHQEHFNFFSDAYAILEITSSLSTSLITCVSQNLKEEQSFSEENFDLSSGCSLGRTKRHKKLFKSENEVRIGLTIDLSRAARIAGERIQAGIDLRLRKANREGGINGAFLRLFIADDKYSPAFTLQNVQEFIYKYDATIILSPLGTSTTKALLPLVRDKKILLLFPHSGANMFRDPELQNIINYRPTYADEARALVRYAKEVLFKQRFAFFYQDDNFGYDPLNAAKEILLNEYDISREEICEASYVRNTILVDKAVKKITLFNPEVIFFFSTYDASRALIEKIGIQKLSNVTLMGISFITDLFRDYASGISDPEQPGKGLSVVLSRVVPDFRDQDIEIVREYHTEMQREYPHIRLDVGSLESYINVSILLDTLKRIDPPYTHEKIIHEMENIQMRNFKGLLLDFDPKTRSLSKTVLLDSGNGGWIKM